MTARNLYFKTFATTRTRSATSSSRSGSASDDDLERDPARATLLVEQVDQMRRSAARLNGRQRRALLLREVEGRSYPEIADSMGISTDAVAHVLARARTRLRERVPPRAEPAGDRDSRPAGRSATCCRPTSTASWRPDAHDEVAAHLATCDACRNVLASYREASIQLRGAAPLSPLAALLERAGAILQGGVAPHDRNRGDDRQQRRDRGGGRRRTGRRAPLRGAHSGGQRRGRDPGLPRRRHDRSRPTVSPARSAAATGQLGCARSGGHESAGRTAWQPIRGRRARRQAPGRHDRDRHGGADGDRAARSVDVTRPVDAILPAETPAVTTPHVTVPPVTTPQITTPHVGTPPIATPIVTVPPVDVPPVTVPPVTTPTVALPAATIPAVTLPKLPGR